MTNYVQLASHKNEKQDYTRAKKLRKSRSPIEQILWDQLRLIPKELGLKFRFQHPLHPYIADFVCLKVKLVIEIDGASHDARLQYDNKRDLYMNELGYTILRFSNDEVV